MFQRHSKNSTYFQYTTDQCSRECLSGIQKSVQNSGTKRIGAQENSWPEEVRGLPPILGHRREPGQYERFAVRQNAHGGRVVVLQEQRPAAACSAVVYVNFVCKYLRVCICNTLCRYIHYTCVKCINHYTYYVYINCMCSILHNILYGVGTHRDVW